MVNKAVTNRKMTGKVDLKLISICFKMILSIHEVDVLDFNKLKLMLI